MAMGYFTNSLYIICDTMCTIGLLLLRLGIIVLGITIPYHIILTLYNTISKKQNKKKTNFDDTQPLPELWWWNKGGM